MKRNILVAILLATNIVTAFCLFRMSWLKMTWEMQARNTSDFAAKVWASNDYGKGKLVKLRLSIEKEPKGFVSKPTEFDGPFVVREWIGYSEPLPFLDRDDSASIQTARIMVASYNQAMSEYHQHPEQYKDRLVTEIENWKKVVRANKDGARKVDAGGGK